MSLNYYDTANYLLQCNECGYIWKPFARDYENFNINDHNCPNCCEAKTEVHQVVKS